jgi:hypothetical protein
MRMTTISTDSCLDERCNCVLSLLVVHYDYMTLSHHWSIIVVYCSFCSFLAHIVEW